MIELSESLTRNRRAESRGKNEGRALSDKLLKCVYCSGEGRLGANRNDFLVCPCRCDCGSEKLTLPDDSTVLQHRSCGKLSIKPRSSNVLIPYSVRSDRPALKWQSLPMQEPELTPHEHKRKRTATQGFLDASENFPPVAE